MSGFANPLLLAALLAVAIPLLLHLVTRQERSGIGFPSLMFVRRVPFEIRRRRTLRDRALLALRCLAIVLLALAFAGPRCAVDPPEVVPGAPLLDTVLLLDRSYSMGVAARWEAATAAVRRRIDALASGERIALLSFTDTAVIVVPATADRGLLRARLAALQPGSGGTGLGAAFELAGELLRESPAERHGIVLVSDLQRSAIDGVDRLYLDEEVALEVETVDAATGANGVTMGAVLDRVDDGGHRLRLALRNTGSAALQGIDVALELAGRPLHRARLDLAAGAEQSLEVPLVLAADGPTPARVVIGEDALSVDNVHHLVLLPERPIELGILTARDRTAAPGAPPAALFVEQALRLAVNPSVRTARLAGPLTAERLAALDVLIADDLALRENGERIDRFVAAGGALLLLPADRAPEPLADDGALLTSGLGRLRSHAAPGLAIELVALPENSPWAGNRAALADALAATRLLASRAFRPAALASPARVLAHLADGSPWLVERPVGRGLSVTLAGGVSGSWGNLALQSGFVPLLHALVGHLARRPPAAMAQVRGAVLDLARAAGNLPDGTAWRHYLAGGGHVVVELPGGGQRALPPGESLYRVEEAGLHQAHRADGAAPVLPIAVNPDRRESLLEVADVTELERRIARRPRPRPAALDGMPAGLDGSPAPGWYLLVAAALLLWLEAQAANWLTWRRQEQTARPPSAATPATAGGR